MRIIQMKDKPNVIVGAIIENKRGEILLIRSDKWDGLYIIPGGHVEFGETAKEALKREVFEETGLKIFDIQFLGYQDCIFPKSYNEKQHLILLDFFCNTEKTTITPNEEVESFLWVPYEKALDFPLAIYTKNAILKYKNNIKAQPGH